MADVTDATGDSREPGVADDGGAAPGRGGDFRSSLRAVLGNRNLRRVQLAFVGSAIGDWAYSTAIVVWAYDVGGAGAVGLWMGIRFVLGAITAPMGAVFADRWPRRRVMILTDAARATLIAGAAVLVALDTATLVVFVLATLASLLSSPFLVAQRALLPSLAETPTQLTAANGVHSTIDSLAFFAGPALAAALLVLTDVPAVLAVNVATFLWSMLLVSRVEVPATPDGVPAASEPDEEADASFLSDTLAGFRVIGRDRAMLLATIQVSLQTVVMGGSVVFLVVMADEILTFGDAGLGYLEAVLGIGAIIGGVVAIGRASRGTLGRDMVTGVVLWSAPLLLVTAWPSAVACFVAVALIGFANPLVDVNMDTIFQRLTPDAMLGRVFGAVEACLIATAALGAFIMAPLLELFGLRAALAAIAVPVVVMALAGLPAMIRVDARLTAPAGLDLLRGIDLFAPLDPATLDQLARSLGRSTHRSGDVLVREGEESDLFYVVETGRVEVTQADRVLRTEGPGEYFGEIGLLRDVPRTATITAVADTVVCTLAREDFLRAVSGHREAGIAAERVVSRRLAS